MLFLLRQIRRKLMQKNKFSTYLLYAIGEIVLVVFGILIAISIDDWNQRQKDSQLELKILQEIHENLKSDLKELQVDLAIMIDINRACETLPAYLSANTKPTASWNELTAMLRVTPHFDPNVGGYNLLASKGIAIVSNDSLRKLLSSHYETGYSYYRRYEEERMRFHALHIEPILLDYFHMTFDTQYKYYMSFSTSPEDYKRLREDEKFIKLLSAIKLENSAVLNRGRRTESNIQSLMTLIETELNY